jgi:hypothetical protein
MSDQQKTGAVTSLEEVFLSREFGRLPSRGISSIGGSPEIGEPPQLEQVFLSQAFGQPEAVTVTRPVLVASSPALAALPGPGASERDSARYRAIAAVSGVAAAALVVVGIASGTGPPATHPTVSAQGPHGSNPTGPTGGSPQGNAAQPSPSGVGPGTTLPSTAASGSGAAVAQLASDTTPTGQQVVVEVPPGTTVEVVTSTPPPPGAGSGGTPPPATSGGGSILTPVLVVVGNTVSTVGATVTATSADLGHALPVASPLTGLLGNLGATVVSLGRSVVGTAT